MSSFGPWLYSPPTFFFTEGLVVFDCILIYFLFVCVFRVLEIEQRKEAVRAAERMQMEIDEDASSGEEDFDEFLDWRAKKSYR